MLSNGAGESVNGEAWRFGAHDGNGKGIRVGEAMVQGLVRHGWVGDRVGIVGVRPIGH